VEINGFKKERERNRDVVGRFLSGSYLEISKLEKWGWISTGPSYLNGQISRVSATPTSTLTFEMGEGRIYRASIATSLDGFISRLDGDIEWLTHPPHNDRHAPPTGSHSAPAEYEQHLASQRLSTTSSSEERLSRPLYPFRNGHIRIMKFSR
jgi:hypothetical protein